MITRRRKCRDLIRAGKTVFEIRDATHLRPEDIAIQRRMMVAAGEIIEGEAGSYSAQKKLSGNRRCTVSGDNYSTDLVDVFAAPRTRKSIAYFNNFD